MLGVSDAYIRRKVQLRFRRGQHKLVNSLTTFTLPDGLCRRGHSFNDTFQQTILQLNLAICFNLFVTNDYLLFFTTPASTSPLIIYLVIFPSFKTPELPNGYIYISPTTVFILLICFHSHIKPILIYDPLLGSFPSQLALVLQTY